jgi:uncharacterized membrane protein required for colicin V production
MFRVVRMTEYVDRGRQRVGAAWQTVNTQPGWIVRTTALVFLLVIGVPILVLLVLAILAALVVFSVLWGVNRLLGGLRGILPRRDGRENVRVIRRIDGQ